MFINYEKLVKELLKQLDEKDVDLSQFKKEVLDSLVKLEKIKLINELQNRDLVAEVREDLRSEISAKVSKTVDEILEVK